MKNFNGPATSELAFNLLSVLEGVRLTAYPDTGGVWTIGLGHTGPDVTPGLTITRDGAQMHYVLDSAPLLSVVEDYDCVPIEGAAWMSFGYNCGLKTLRMLLGFASAQERLSHMVQYVHDRHGNIDPGLVSRRNLEAALVRAADLQYATWQKQLKS